MDRRLDGDRVRSEDVGKSVFSRTVQLERMTSPEVKLACEEARGVAIIPVGAVEVHGPHLPVGTDSFETFEIGHRAAKQAGVVITPMVWFGNSRAFMDFPGSIAVRPEVLKELVKDIALSLLHHGFNRIVILDGHGGNYGILDTLIEEVHLETGALICHARAWELASLPKPADIPPYDGHGGSSETSVMLVICPEDVDREKFIDSAPQVELTRFGSVFPSPSGPLDKGPITFPLSMGEMVEAGHHGVPSRASRDRGEDLLRVKAEALAEFLESLKLGAIRWRGSNRI
jgi:creatinine amidohydrolase